MMGAHHAGSQGFDDDIIAFMSYPPIGPSRAGHQRVEPACGNFTVNTTSFPELTLPIENTILGSQFSDLTSLTGVVLVMQIGPASGFVIGLNRVVNSSIYRVPATQLMPGALFDVQPTPPQFTPYLQFVGDVGSTAGPSKRTAHLDLDEYQ
jgi:hypothetical protein